MKTLNYIFSAVLMFSTSFIMAQSPEAFNYQAVIRDNVGTSISNQQITMDFKVRQGSINGNLVYHEQHIVTTDSRGLIALQVGNGSTILLGSIQNVNWNTGLYFLETSVDRGSGLSLMGTAQLLSVPYAFHSNTADSLVGGVTFVETDPVFNNSLASSITISDTTHWGAHTINTDTQIDSVGIANLGFFAGAHTVDMQIDSSGIDALGFDAGPHTADTQIDSTGITLYGFVAGVHTIDTQIDSFGISNLGYVAGPHTVEIDGDVTNELQNLGSNASGTNRTISITNGTGTSINVADNDNDISNEIQTLSINNNALSLDKGGGSINLPVPTKVDTSYNLQIESSQSGANGISSLAAVITNAQGFGAPLYINTNGQYSTTDASDGTKIPCVALALETGTGTKSILHYGFITNSGWSWTVGARIYVSVGAGVMTQTPPNGNGEYVQPIGYATSSTTMMFIPDMTLIELK